MAKQKEMASERVRVFPSSLDRINMRRAKKIGGKSQAKVIEDLLEKATLYEKLILKNHAK